MDHVKIVHLVQQQMQVVDAVWDLIHNLHSQLILLKMFYLHLEPFVLTTREGIQVEIV